MDDIKLTFHKASTETELAIPLAQSSVKAGFPSPAQDYMSEEIDLNRLLIPHPEATASRSPPATRTRGRSSRSTVESAASIVP